MNHWQDTENPMILPHAEPDESTSPEEDDGEKQRQQDTDTAKEKRASNHYVPDHAKATADYWLKAFDDIFKDEGVSMPTTPRNGKF